MTADTPIGIVLLAAGAAQRFAGEKMGRMLAGRRLIDWSVAAALESGVGPVWVVIRPGETYLGLEKVTLVANPEWQSGLGSSVRTGLQAVTGCAAAILAPADQPLLTGEVYRRLAARFAEGATVAVASYGGKPRNPVLLAASRWAAASELNGDVGLSVLARSPDAAWVECGTFASIADVDSPEDLAAITLLLSRK